MKKFDTYGRTKKVLVNAGYRCEKVEMWIPGIGIRKDFLGCIDMLAMRPKKKKILGIQLFTTAWTDHQRKICEEYPDGAKFWLRCGHELWFVGWRKLKVKRGGKAVIWTPRYGQVVLKKKRLELIEVEPKWK